MPGLGTSFGRGGATTAQNDLANADCVLIMGSSMAEAHPVGFRWVMAARERGATVIHVDPRFTRTSACADQWLPLRAGSDIVLLGGLVRWVLEHNRCLRDYIVHFTNAAVILKPDFVDAEDNDGIFSGWDEEQRRYDPSSWKYEGDDTGHPRRDPTLTHPRCVYQVLRRHFARYTTAEVERLCGVPATQFERLAQTLADNSGTDRTTAICYAVGWTQHSTGVQIIRTAAVLQLLLGNIGRPGGGILALRGHASIQGSTDIPTLYDTLPGYMPMPKDQTKEETLAGWLQNHVHPTGLWNGLPNYVTSLLKAWYGARATAANDYGFGWLPRLTGDHSHFSYFARMADGEVEGLFVMGQNPAVGGQHARLERKALARLQWLVVRDMVETETAAFWRDAPEIGRGELDPARIDTEVFLMPAAGHAEKAGAFTNTQRLLQWREKAVSPPGDARSEAWFVHQLALRLRRLAAASDDADDEPLRALDWWYPEDDEGGPEMPSVLAEINGWHTDPAAGADDVVHQRDRDGVPHHGGQVANYEQLKDDGSTACGCWIYSGVYGPDGVNKANGREPRDELGHGWGFAWPGDRRILYNRASARPDGQPWSERKQLVHWDGERWTGRDEPDFPEQKAPDYQPPPDAKGTDALPGDAPFVVHPDGLGWLFAPSGLKDGPMPTHYEPLEGPALRSLYGQRTNPAVNWFTRRDNPYARTDDPRFPYVLTTYRLTEHHTAGGMSRCLSHLAELQPEMFAELSPELAAELGIEHGGWLTVVTLRSAIEARALVTRRLRPLRIDGRTVHQVALPFHWGTTGPHRGDAANDLIGLSGEPNVTIHESKALTCAVLPGRRPRDQEFARWFATWGGGEQDEDQGPPERHAADAPVGGARPGGHGHEGMTQ